MIKLQIHSTVILAIYFWPLDDAKHHILNFESMSWFYDACHLPQVIETHYARSLGVWSERAGDLSDNGTDAAESPEPGKHPDVTMYWSLSVAIFSIGGMLSSFLVGFVGDLRGRRATPQLIRPRLLSGFVAALPSFLSVSNRVKGMLVINVLPVAAGLLMGLCRIWKPHIMVILGRFIMGFYCGNSNSIIGI